MTGFLDTPLIFGSVQKLPHAKIAVFLPPPYPSRPPARSVAAHTFPGCSPTKRTSVTQKSQFCPSLPSIHARAGVSGRSFSEAFRNYLHSKSCFFCATHHSRPNTQKSRFLPSRTHSHPPVCVTVYMDASLASGYVCTIF